MVCGGGCCCGSAHRLLAGPCSECVVILVGNGRPSSGKQDKKGCDDWADQAPDVRQGGDLFVRVYYSTPLVRL